MAAWLLPILQAGALNFSLRNPTSYEKTLLLSDTYQATSPAQAPFSASLFFFFNFIYLFIYLFIFGCAGSSVRARALSSCGKRGPLFTAVRGPLFIAVRGPLTIAAPPAAGHRLQTRRLSSCGSRAQPPHGTWDPPRPGPEPASPALAGRPPTKCLSLKFEWAAWIVTRRMSPLT